MNKIKTYLAVIAGFVVIGSPAYAGVFEDGTMDLWVLLAGKTTAINLGFAGVGVQFVNDGEGYEVNAEPTFLNLSLGVCKLPWVEDQSLCGEDVEQ